MKFYIKFLSVVFILNLIFLIPPSVAKDKHLKISKIYYQSHELTELDEIPLNTAAGKSGDAQFQNKVDELINLLEAQKKAAEEGRNIDLLREKVNEINKLLEEKKAGPPKLTGDEFRSSICFNCHRVNDFSPSDKTQNQWRRLIEADGHSIFENISWESSDQKRQVLEFLLDHAGSHRAEGIGLWK